MNHQETAPTFRNKTKTTDALYQTHLTTVVKGAGLSFSGTLVGKALLLLFTLIIARNLGSQSVGLYFLALAIIKIAVVPSLAGLDSGIIRYVSLFSGEDKVTQIKGVIFSSFLIAGPLSILMTISLFLSSHTLAVNVFNKPHLEGVLKLFAVSIPFLVCSQLFFSVFLGLKFMRYRTYTKDLLDGILRTVLAIIAIYLGFHLFGVIVATIVTAIGVTLAAFYYTSRSVPLLNKSVKFSLEFKELLRFSFPQLFSNALFLGILYTDILMLGIYLPASEIGIYSLAVKISVVGALFLESFSAIFAPFISDLYNRKETEMLSKLFKAVTKWIFTLSFPISLFLMLAAKPILQSIGPEFVAGSMALIVLTLGQIINATAGPSELMIVMSGRPIYKLIGNTIVFALNIFLNIILIPKYGILGAAISSATAISLLNIGELLIVWFALRMHPFEISYIKPLVSSIVALLIMLTGIHLLGVEKPVLLLIIAGTMFFFVYTIMLVLLGINKEDRLVLQALRNKFSGGVA